MTKKEELQKLYNLSLVPDEDKIETIRSYMEKEGFPKFQEVAKSGENKAHILVKKIYESAALFVLKEDYKFTEEDISVQDFDSEYLRFNISWRS